MVLCLKSLLIFISIRVDFAAASSDPSELMIEQPLPKKKVRHVSLLTVMCRAQKCVLAWNKSVVHILVQHNL